MLDYFYWMNMHMEEALSIENHNATHTVQMKKESNIVLNNFLKWLHENIRNNMMDIDGNLNTQLNVHIKHYIKQY